MFNFLHNFNIGVVSVFTAIVGILNIQPIQPIQVYNFQTASTTTQNKISSSTVETKYKNISNKVVVQQEPLQKINTVSYQQATTSSSAPQVTLPPTVSVSFNVSTTTHSAAEERGVENDKRLADFNTEVQASKDFIVLQKTPEYRIKSTECLDAQSKITDLENKMDSIIHYGTPMVGGTTYQICTDFADIAKQDPVATLDALGKCGPLFKDKNHYSNNVQYQIDSAKSICSSVKGFMQLYNYGNRIIVIPTPAQP